MSAPARLTRFASYKPSSLGKTFSLSTDGSLTKTTAGQMVEGVYTVESFATVHDLAALLKSVRTDQAISSSLPVSGADSGRVVTERALGVNVGAVARTKRFFRLLSGQAGLLTLDHDPAKGEAPLSIAQLWSLLCDVCPAVADAGVIAWHSGSSLIYEGDKQHRGVGGVHLYVLVRDLSDTERFGKALSARLWLAGHGRIEVSASGAMLARTIFDEAVHQPARLLFSGGAVCTPPLEQRRGDPVILADGGFLDTRAALPNLNADDEGRYLAAVESAKAQSAPRALAARQAWREARQREQLAEAVVKGLDVTEASASIGRTLDAALGGTLVGSFPLIVVDDEGREHGVTVDQVLKDRDRYHLSRCLDPLNPEHRDRSPDALLYLNQAQPICYSLDDGGTVYRLLRQPTRLAVTAGDKARLAEQVADELATEQDLFASAGQAVRVSGGDFSPLSRPLLLYRIGCRVSLYRQGKDKQTATDLDQPTLDMVAALLPERLRKITGRASIPLIDTDGRVIERPGFDAETGMFLDLTPDQLETIEQAPDRQQAVEALRRAWAPWSAYRWATSHDRAAMLAAVLTIPLRPTIDAAPGLFADAPSQASGKSKAVGAIAAIVRGHRGGLKSWLGDNESEVEKFLLGAARSGDSAVVLDNIVGVFRSQSLATAIVEGKVSARLLGQNLNLTPECRVMWLASANQTTTDRDMATRWLVARIDTGAESPQLLSYSFDPVERALSDRLGIARAAITLHRAWHCAGKPRADSINTRFADWGRTVRQLVLWLHDSGIADEAGIGPLGDPARSILEGSAANDPEAQNLELTLHALFELIGTEPFSSADVRRMFEKAESSSDPAMQALHEGLSGLMTGQQRRNTVSTQAISWTFRFRRDRPCGGLKLVEVPQVGRAATRGSLWRLEIVQPLDTEAA